MRTVEKTQRQRTCFVSTSTSSTHEENQFVIASTKRFVNTAVANQKSGGDNLLVTEVLLRRQLYFAVVTTHIAVVTEDIVTTILICCGYFNKTFCWDKKSFFPCKYIICFENQEGEKTRKN